MRLSISNLALPRTDQLTLLPVLRDLGIEGVELAPGHTWPMFEGKVMAQEIDDYRRAAETAGLEIVGLHALLDNRSDLGLFKDAETQNRTRDHLMHLSTVCRDLGARTLVLGPRGRPERLDRAAWWRCRSFLEDLLPRIEEHGTVLCFAPLEPTEGDFCATARDCYVLVNALDHPSFGLHLDAAGLAANDETGHTTFVRVSGRLDHFHANEPNLAVLGSTGQVDHADLRRHLASIHYFGWLSVIQRMIPGTDPLETLRRGIHFVADRYLPLDLR